MKNLFLRNALGAAAALALLLTAAAGCSTQTETPDTSSPSSAGTTSAGEAEDPSASASSAADPSATDSSAADPSDPASTVPGGSSVVNTTAGNGGKTNGTTSGKTTAKTTNDWNKDWSGSKAVARDLGSVNLKEYPVDYSYDWGHCCLKIGDTYKMWWTRSSPWDGVWYAESKDLKNWSKTQCIAKIASQADYKTYVKQHIADPAVVYLNGTYHFWFETNMVVDANGEAYGGNAIIYATSKDGIHLNWYQNNEKEGPLPVMQPTGANITNGSYGTGMPSVIYKDGQFMLYYYDGSVDAMRVATSKDGIHFPQNEKNPITIQRAGVGFAYNKLTGKYMAAVLSNPRLASASAPNVDAVYLTESTDGINWTYKTPAEIAKHSDPVSSQATGKVRSFAEFVRDPYGMIDTPTLYLTWSEGAAPPAGQGWMTYADTFDGHIGAVNPAKYAKRTIDLPNGKTMNAANLKAYADSTLKWNTQSGTAKKGTPVIDGKKDAVWDKTAVLKVARTAPVSGMYPTDTTGKVQLLWDENNLYIYAEIADAHVSYKYPIKKLADMYHRDSLSVFVDVPRDRSKPATAYTAKQYCYSICANGDDVVINPTKNLDISKEFTKQSVVTRTKTGYTIEACVSWHDLVKDQVKAGKVIGLDIGINDDLGNGDREACVSWSDYKGNAFRDYTALGNITLLG